MKMVKNLSVHSRGYVGSRMISVLTSHNKYAVLKVIGHCSMSSDMSLFIFSSVASIFFSLAKHSKSSGCDLTEFRVFLASVSAMMLSFPLM